MCHTAPGWYKKLFKSKIEESDRARSRAPYGTLISTIVYNSYINSIRSIFQQVRNPPISENINKSAINSI